MMFNKSILEMSIGETGLVINMEQVELHNRHRFMDLGIAPYAKVTLLKKLNFNHLFIIDVDDVEICIRKSDAKKILVQV